ncbi:MAG TPA: GntR family transcriptional regulator [Clostridiaceae bacterium]|nr:GntR family transcriptional regulator [Clostridiaceae bacterium]
MVLDKNGPIPVYSQLKAIIQNRIQSGEYAEGELIPSERDLAKDFGISRMTVRQALNQMVAEGMLVRERGKGTFVSRQKLQQRNISSFSETVRAKGMVPSTKVLYFKKERAGEEMADILGMSKDAQVYAFKRLRFADGIPVGLEQVYIPVYLCPDLESYQLEASLYQILSDKYGLKIDYMDNIIEASAATAEERKLLNISSSVPVLRITGVSYISGGRKFSYEKDIYRGDQYSYNVRIFLQK